MVYLGAPIVFGRGRRSESRESVEEGGLALWGKRKGVWEERDGMGWTELVIELDEFSGGASEGEIVSGGCWNE